VRGEEAVKGNGNSSNTADRVKVSHLLDNEQNRVGMTRP
jgi:hypothetical protein